MKFCRLENYSCQGTTPTSHLTAAPGSQPQPALCQPPLRSPPSLFLTQRISDVNFCKRAQAWESIPPPPPPRETLAKFRLVCPFLRTKTLRGTKLNHIARSCFASFFFPIVARLHFLAGFEVALERGQREDIFTAAP